MEDGDRGSSPTPGSGRCEKSSDRCPPSKGYPSPSEEGRPPVDGQLPKPSEEWNPPRPGPWETEDLHASIARAQEERRRREEPAGGWLPGERELDQEDREDRPELEFRKEWRVTIRLRHSQYEQLAVAADLYGVRPTTMARMLTNRGANAVVNAYRRDELGPRGR